VAFAKPGMVIHAGIPSWNFIL